MFWCILRTKLISSLTAVLLVLLGTWVSFAKKLKIFGRISWCLQSNRIEAHLGMKLHTLMFLYSGVYFILCVGFISWTSWPLLFCFVFPFGQICFLCRKLCDSRGSVHSRSENPACEGCRCRWLVTVPLDQGFWQGAGTGWVTDTSDAHGWWDHC